MSDTKDCPHCLGYGFKLIGIVVTDQPCPFCCGPVKDADITYAVTMDFGLRDPNSKTNADDKQDTEIFK